MAVLAEHAERGSDGVPGFVAIDNTGVYVGGRGHGGRVAQVLGYFLDHPDDRASGSAAILPRRGGVFRRAGFGRASGEPDGDEWFQESTRCSRWRAASPNFGNVTFTVRNSSFAYGAFLTDVLAFLISALVVYYVLVVPVTRLIQRSSGTRQRPTATAPSAR